MRDPSRLTAKGREPLSPPIGASAENNGTGAANRSASPDPSTRTERMLSLFGPLRMYRISLPSARPVRKKNILGSQSNYIAITTSLHISKLFSKR
jgi:hypothetical protein